MLSDLALNFSTFDVISLEPAQALLQIEGGVGVALNSKYGDFVIELAPNDVRAPDYRAQEVSASGKVTDLAHDPSRTYKGHVKGAPASWARFTIDQDTVEGLFTSQGMLSTWSPYVTILRRPEVGIC